MNWQTVPLTDQDREMATIAGLSDDEARFAKATGESFLRYAALKDVRSPADFERVEAEDAERQRAAVAARAAEAQQRAQAARLVVAEEQAQADRALTARAAAFGLTGEELAFAEASAMDPAEYAAWKTVDNSGDADLVAQRAAEINQRAADTNAQVRAELAEVEAIMAEVEARQAR